MVERFFHNRKLLDAAVLEIREFRPEIMQSKATLLIIDDEYYKFRLLSHTLIPPNGERKLPVALFEAKASEEGAAWVKMYLTSQDLTREDKSAQRIFPPLVIALDASFPIRNSLHPVPRPGMGIKTAEKIINYCIGSGKDRKLKEGSEEFPIPFFMGLSKHPPHNDELKKLLEGNNAGDKYLGDYWEQPDAVIDALKKLITPPIL